MCGLASGGLMALSAGASTPLRSLGEFFRMSWETLTLIPRRPFAWSEFLFQSWFVARVALLPTLMLAIPFTVLAVFTFNILLGEFGAAHYSGVGAGEGGVTQIGPIVTGLVISYAGFCLKKKKLAPTRNPPEPEGRGGNTLHHSA